MTLLRKYLIILASIITFGTVHMVVATVVRGVELCKAVSRQSCCEMLSSLALSAAWLRTGEDSTSQHD